MGKSSPKPPPAPDPVKTAQAQAQANKEAIQESARVNSYNMYTPWGAVTYTKDSTGVPTAQYLQLSPGQQSLLDQQTAISGDLANQAQIRVDQLPTGPFNLDGITPLISQGDVQRYASDQADAFYNASARRLNDQFAKDRASLDQSLYDRGHPQGSGQAYDDAMSGLQETQYGTLSDLSNQAQGYGLQQAQGLFGLSQTARNQDISDRILGRNQAFNEAAAFIQGSPVLPTPSAPQLPAYQMAPADIMGATYNSYNAQMNNYNQQMAQRNAGMSGLFGLAGNLIGLF